MKSMYEILEQIEIVKIEMKKHRSDWFGMIGTADEKADWNEKVQRLHRLQNDLIGAR